MHICHKHYIIMIFSRKKKVVEAKEIFLVTYSLEVKLLPVSVTMTHKFFNPDIIIRLVGFPNYPNQWKLISQVFLISHVLTWAYFLPLLFIFPGHNSKWKCLCMCFSSAQAVVQILSPPLKALLLGHSTLLSNCFCLKGLLWRLQVMIPEKHLKYQHYFLSIIESYFGTSLSTIGHWHQFNASRNPQIGVW